MRRAALLLCVSLMACSSSRSEASPSAAPGDSAAVAQQLLDNGDAIGFRVYLRKLAAQKRIRSDSYHRIKRIILQHPDRVGFDLMYLWNASNPQKPSEIDRELEAGDQLMLGRRFSEAFSTYQGVARKLKKMSAAEKNPERKLEQAALYPFAVHFMGRALYGARRYHEAYVTYSWLGPEYPRFRQVLFERMWAAFRLGRVDLALGAIASQHSAYFSQFLPSESYLIQNYIYRKLCRTDELAPLLDEMKLYESALERNDLEAWATTDLERRVLWKLAQDTGDSSVPAASAAEKAAERARIRQGLEGSFAQERPKVLRDLKFAMAYAELAESSGSSVVLQPVEKLPSRAAYLSMNLEVWPAGSREEWADEVGSYVFFGESHCARKEHP
jgi:hypothetical protein